MTITAQVISISEGCFRTYASDSSLKACTRYLRNQKHHVTFYTGDIELRPMTKQLKGQRTNGRRLKYNADGTITTDKSQLELLLMEVSLAYGDNDKGKTSFDHYKAMVRYATLLRTLPDHVKLAKFETFSRIKVHFFLCPQ